MKAMVSKIIVPGVILVKGANGKECEVITPINVAPPAVGDEIEVIDGHHQYVRPAAKKK